ncbi:MAG: guanylate kinase [Planctomycetes bacterium]|nr:guanylate kinase [Planctomycetota bacterium]
MSSNHDGKIIIVSGPSGVGKSTICREVVNRLDNVFLSVSATTRTKSESEVDGKDYWFLTRGEFEKRIEDGMFLEYAEVFGNLYGTPKDKTDKAIEDGKNVILEIDVQGARRTKQIYPDAEMVFILAPTHKDLAERLNGRARDGEKVVEERLSGASAEIAAAWQFYEHMVINDDLQQAVNEVIQIIQGNIGE